MTDTPYRRVGRGVAAALLVLVAAAPALSAEASGPAGSPRLGQVLAQALPRPGAPAAVETREAENYLRNLEQLRSGCENAGWTLWHSNSYKSWRERKSSMLSMNYSGGFFPALPPTPAALADAAKVRAEEAVRRANETLREASSAFKDLANYVNAKDYEDDKFKKGDDLNARLLALGRDCHVLHGQLTGLYVELADILIERGRAGAAKPEVVAAMTADWAKARALSAELAKGPGTDMGRVETLVREISTLVDERRKGFEAEMAGGQGSLSRFYDKVLNEWVAVKMRKLLREAKADPAALKEAAADRPRSTFRVVRSDIDVQLADAVLSMVRQGK